MVHIVFQQADVAVLREAMKLDGSLEGDIVEIRDEWAVGPLRDLDTEEGWNRRLDWWRELLKGSPYEKMMGSFDDRSTVQNLLTRLRENEAEEAWIWMGQNAHDVTGYFWLMRQMREFQGRLLVLYLNNLPFINEKGQLFYPNCVHEILPKEAVKAKKLARPVTLSEFEVDPDEWKKISEEDAPVRMLEGGKKIVGRDAGFYDSEILKNLTPEWQKATRALTNTINRMKIRTGDVYLMWRIKQLISEGRIDALGDTNQSWKDFDVRLPGAAKAGAAQAQEATA